MFSVIFGAVINALGGSPTIAELVHQVDKVKKLPMNIQHNQTYPQATLLMSDDNCCAQVCLYFIYLAIVAFVASYGEIGLWMWTGILATTVRVAAHQSMRS